MVHKKFIYQTRIFGYTLNAHVIRFSCPWERKFIPLKIPSSNLWMFASSHAKWQVLRLNMELREIVI